MTFETELVRERKPNYDGVVAPDRLVDLAATALREARDYLFSVQHKDFHWCAELESNVTITSEYVLMRQALGLEISDSKRSDLIKYLLSNQKNNGSWGIADLHEGDLS